MTPDHEAQLYEAARDNTVLKMMLDLRHNSALNDQPMTDEDFYHVTLMTMTDVANTFHKLATEHAMRAPTQLIFKGSDEDKV